MKKKIISITVFILCISILCVCLCACNSTDKEVMAAARLGWNKLSSDYIVSGSDWKVNSIDYVVLPEKYEDKETCYVFKVNWESTFLYDYYDGDIYVAVIGDFATDYSAQTLYEQGRVLNYESGSLSKKEIKKITGK